MFYVVSDKLQELNKKLGGGPHHIEENLLENVVKLAEPQNSLDSNFTLILQKILQWPQGKQSSCK